MNPGQLIPTDEALKVLLKQYRNGQPLCQAQLDCLVHHGILATANGAYWTTSRAASLLPG